MLANYYCHQKVVVHGFDTVYVIEITPVSILRHISLHGEISVTWATLDTILCTFYIFRSERLNLWFDTLGEMQF